VEVVPAAAAAQEVVELLGLAAPLEGPGELRRGRDQGGGLLPAKEVVEVGLLEEELRPLAPEEVVEAAAATAEREEVTLATGEGGVVLSKSVPRQLLSCFL
jgi:hypothetical protein